MLRNLSVHFMHVSINMKYWHKFIRKSPCLLSSVVAWIKIEKMLLVIFLGKIAPRVLFIGPQPRSKTRHNLWLRAACDEVGGWRFSSQKAVFYWQRNCVILRTMWHRFATVFSRRKWRETDDVLYFPMPPIRNPYSHNRLAVLHIGHSKIIQDIFSLFRDVIYIHN
jgi:hypothetical protein